MFPIRLGLAVQRFLQLLFIISILTICWLGMMAVHELGHVIGAWLTGGVIQQVVLSPLTISRTDVGPNPQPAIVVWLGPILGSNGPLLVWFLMPKSQALLAKSVGFFAGFCLIVNGAYIGIGSFEGVGDCAVMLRTGSPVWLLVIFGAVAVTGGLAIWHRLGSLREFLNDPAVPAPFIAWILFGSVIAIVAVELTFSPR